MTTSNNFICSPIKSGFTFNTPHLITSIYLINWSSTFWTIFSKFHFCFGDLNLKFFFGKPCFNFLPVTLFLHFLTAAFKSAVFWRYIPALKKWGSEINFLDDEVKKYDPLISLDGGYNGLAAYKEILESIKKIGKKNLLVLFEIGFDQATPVNNMMQKYGFNKIQIFNDYCNLPRCILGKT